MSSDETQPPPPVCRFDAPWFYERTRNTNDAMDGEDITQEQELIDFYSGVISKAIQTADATSHIADAADRSRSIKQRVFHTHSSLLGAKFTMTDAIMYSHRIPRYSVYTKCDAEIKTLHTEEQAYLGFLYASHSVIALDEVIPHKCIVSYITQLLRSQYFEYKSIPNA